MKCMDVQINKRHALLASMVLATMAVSATAQQQLSLFDVPPYIAEAADPNLVITFDDSSSMYWGFVPDEVGTNHALLAAKSSHYNKLYYDPAATYLPPFRADGNPFPPANFNAALTNPFNNAIIFSSNPSASVSGDDGSRIRLEPAVNTVDLATQYSVRWNVASGTEPLQSELYPLLAGGVGGAAFYNDYDTGLSGCDATAALDEDCYITVTVSATSGVLRRRPELPRGPGGEVQESTDERQNFANWYQYYSLRVLAAKTALSQTFVGGNVNGSVRVAHQSFAAPGPKSGMALMSQPTVRQLADDRQNLFRWFFGIEQGSASPLRTAMVEAGKFFSQSSTSAIGVYNETPSNTANPGPAMACRNNFHLMVTDGVWNGDDGLVFPGSTNADNVAVALPDGVQYPATSPLYRGATEKTLADLAFHYWATDAAPLRNNVVPLFRDGARDDEAAYWNHRNDPADWQHVRQLALSFGVTSTVPVATTTLDAMFRGTPFTDNQGDSQTTWPAFNVLAPDAAGKTDDLYHATVNSRGGYFSARNPDDLARAINWIASSVTNDHVNFLPISVNTGAVSSEAMIFRAEYNGKTRAGDIKAFRIATGTQGSPCAGEAGAVCETPAWQLNRGGYHPAPNIYTYNPDGVGGKGVDFAAGRFTADMLDLLRLPNESNELVADRIDYLRGSDAKEVSRGGPFRNRTPEQRTMGPILNSAPVFVGNGFNANGSREIDLPDDLETETFSDYLVRIKGRTPMVYVGSNDGKLHAINASDGSPVFDYVPRALFSGLALTTQSDFGDKPGVDGSIATADVFIDREWRTVLVGGLRTGGKGYYALDITDPTSGNASSKVLWEITNESEKAAELGFSYSRPVIVKSNARLSTGGSRWVAIFGNGYNSVNGEAVLFIVDIATGDVLRTISTRSEVSQPEPFIPNGLNTPAAVFADGNYTADYVYAGDLRGNLWKFDLSSSDPEDWKVAFGATGNGESAADYDPKPLFEARDSQDNIQPITAPPVVGGHPQGRDGLMVYFGTGKYLERSDMSVDEQQSFYGVWDKDLCQGGAGSVACITLSPDSDRKHVNFGTAGARRSNMVPQRVETQNNDSRQVTDNNIDWLTQFGWYLDFPASNNQPAERVIAQAQLRSGIVLFPTFIPPAGACEGMGTGWLMALSRVNGGLLDHEPFVSTSREIDNSGGDSGPSAGRSIDTQLLQATILTCGDRSCVVSDEMGNMEQLDEGMHWGRWQWQVLRGKDE
jgi:type IV pilus assembly protein PilY1